MHSSNAAMQVIQFGKLKGTTMKDLLLNHYHYAKWLINQPTSTNKNFETARTCLNMLLEDDEFVSQLADKLPPTKPNHKVQPTIYDGVNPNFTPKVVMHIDTEENDGIDFLLVSRIDPINNFVFEQPQDLTLFNNFMGKYEQDGDDTLLILQRINGYLLLLNYKFVEKIVANEGECDFLWQS